MILDDTKSKGNLDIESRLQKLRNKSKLGGGKERIEAQHKKGKLTARERIELLVDTDSFTEIDSFVMHNCTKFGMEQKKISWRWCYNRLWHY